MLLRLSIFTNLIDAPHEVEVAKLLRAERLRFGRPLYEHANSRVFT